MAEQGRGHIHRGVTLGQRAADAVVAAMGSWRFIAVQTVIVAAWVAANLLAFVARWDPYPFILLNLVFSTQAAYASPLILMASNRQAERDKKRDDVEADEVHRMVRINTRQLEILEILHELQAGQGR